MWTVCIIVGLTVWVALALLVAVVIGRGIRLADGRSAEGGRHALAAARAAAPGRSRRRSVPLPPVGVALAAIAVTLESVGFAVRLSGEHLPALSMDGQLSVPRMFVASLFGGAAIAAQAGAARIPGRRTWWTAVALVSGGISVVKAGGTVHADAMRALTSWVGRSGAGLVSLLLAGGVLVTLFTLSRHDRRDRRRVLGSLGGYAFASVVLSGISGFAAGTGNATAATIAAYLEESGEALGAVTVLVAVLVGVAPRLVLPADWAMRRAADAHTLEVASTRVARPGVEGRLGS